VQRRERNKNSRVGNVHVVLCPFAAFAVNSQPDPCTRLCEHARQSMSFLLMNGCAPELCAYTFPNHNTV
jgi:hypothetical protein